MEGQPASNAPDTRKVVKEGLMVSCRSNEKLLQNTNPSATNWMQINLWSWTPSVLGSSLCLRVRNNQTGRWRLFWVPVGYHCYMQWSTCRRWLRNMKKAKDSEIISWNLSYHRSSLNHFLKRSEAIESPWNLAFVTLRVKLIIIEIRREFSDLIYRFQKKVDHQDSYRLN